MYSIILFLLTTSDAIMSYLSPVLIGNYVQNNFIMGCIIAFSSLVGVISDFLLPNFFRNKSYLFFIWGTVLTALLFPSIFLFIKPSIAAFLLAMGVWGLYYEMNLFANYNVVHTFLKNEQHAAGWGIIYSFRSAAYLVGPLIVGMVSFVVERAALYYALLFLFLSMLGFTLFPHAFTKKHQLHQSQEVPPPKERLNTELKIWNVLFRKIWPLYLFVFSLFILDSTYWTVGVLLSEQMRQAHAWGSLLLPLRTLPALFMLFLAPKLARPFGKKRIAFYSAFVSACLLILQGFMQNDSIFILLAFTSSLFSAIAIPEIYATFEDYMSRLGSHGNDIVGLENSAGSLAYIVGPIVAGGIAALVGYRFTFTIVGIFLALCSLTALIIVPRKIKMPKKAIEHIVLSS